ncbi:MAG: hypothetical protein EOP07_07910 [Proteobacteria bacterium]|nr:MAG: hypothetical protein EOP07_07910 [Pseudomonadota bacterium]
MKRLAFTLSSIAALSACKTTSTSAAKSLNSPSETTVTSVRLPAFDLMEWQKHPGGPLQEPFFLQNEVYSFRIDTPTLLNADGKTLANYSITTPNGTVLASGQGTFKVRGFTSRDFPKKQYSFTPVDDKGKDLAVSILGMPAAEDWVISAPYADKTLLRDVVAFNVGNKLGRHAPRTRIMKLYMAVGDAKVQNHGVYVLTEKNTFGPGRIEVAKKNELGTAFQATFDHLHEGDNVVWSGRDTDVVLEYPSATKITPDQQAQFLTIFKDAESRIAQSTGAGWTNIFEERLDLDSAVDFFIGQEITRNIDGFRLSSGFYIAPQSEKIVFGPLWDFNIAYGNAAHENGIQWNNWRSLEKGVWFGKLLAHPQFCSALKTKWQQKRSDGSISNDTIFGIVDAHAALVKPYAPWNFKKWGGLGEYLWPNPYWLDTHEDEVNALKSWISLRTEWMDTAITGMSCDGVQPVSFVRDARTDKNNNQLCEENELCIFNGNQLQWYRASNETLNHIDASRACQALDASTGYTGWRLPRDNEVTSAQAAGLWNSNNPALLNLKDAPYWNGNGEIPVPGAYSATDVYRVNVKTAVRDLQNIGVKSNSICVRTLR